MDELDDLSYSFYRDKGGYIDSDIVNNCKTDKNKDHKKIEVVNSPPDPIAIITKRSKERWTEDSAVNNCQGCNATFRIYRRRHHCILKGTPITLSDGTSRNIEDIGTNTYVTSYNSVFNCIQNNKIVDTLFDQGYEPCYKIILEDGREIIATSDHKFLINKNKDNEYIQLKNLKRDDRIVCSAFTGVNIGNCKESLEDLARARLAGFFKFGKIEDLSGEDLLSLERDIKLTNFPSEFDIKLKSIDCKREYIAAFFGNRKMENEIFGYEEQKNKLLEAEEINNWLNELGVNSTLEISCSEEKYIFDYSMSLKDFAEKIGIRYSSQKSKELHLLALKDKLIKFQNNEEFHKYIGYEEDKGYYSLKIRDISSYKNGQPQHVYDLSVPGNVSFVAQGVVCHNCILEGTPVTLSNGMARKIEEVYPTQKLPSWDPDMKNIDNNSKFTDALMDQGFESCLKITLLDGRELVATPDHEILAIGPENSEPEYIQMQNLTSNHKVVCSTLHGVLDEPKLDADDYIIQGTNFSIINDREKSLAFARLCGYALTDGSLCERGNRVVFMMGDIDDSEAMCCDIELLLNEKIKRPTLQDTGKGSIYRIEFCSAILKKWFEDAGVTIGCKVDQGMKIPHFMWDDKCPKSIQREFIAGWFGGDGSRFGLSGNSDTLKTNDSLVSVCIQGKDAKEILRNAMLSVERMNNIIKSFGVNSNSMISRAIAIIPGLPTPTSNSSQQLNVVKNGEEFVIVFDTMTRILDILFNKGTLKYSEIFELLENDLSEDDFDIKNYKSSLTKVLENDVLLGRTNKIAVIENGKIISKNTETRYYITEAGKERLQLVRKWVDDANDPDNKEVQPRITCRVGFNIPLNAMLDFNEKIGFRYSIEKQIKMTIGTSYTNYRKRLTKQRVKLFNIAMDSFFLKNPKIIDPRNETKNFIQKTTIKKKMVIEHIKVAEKYGKDNNYDPCIIIDEKFIKGFIDLIKGKTRTYEDETGKILAHSNVIGVSEFLNIIGFDWEEKSRFGKRYFALPIISNEIYREGEPQHVYDLSVPENVSFVAQGVVCHNCRSCVSVFCDTCSSYRAKIPKVIKKIPTRTGKEEPIDYNTEVRLCLKCYDSYQEIHKLEKLFTIFSLLRLNLYDFKIIACVSKQWNLISAFYMSKFREIQYKLPKSFYNSWEKQALWTNRYLLKNHSIWETHVLRSVEGQKFIEAVNIYFPEKIDEMKRIPSYQGRQCWNRMCCRYCRPFLDPERALLLLDVLEKKVEIRAKDIVAEKIAESFNSCSENIFECYLPFILYKLLLSNNEILKNFVFEKCRKNLRIANSTYWYLKMNNKTLLLEMVEKIPQEFYSKIIKTQTFTEIVSNGEKIKGKMISVVCPERDEQEIFTDKISIKESATRPTLIPCSKGSILYKKDDVRKDYIIMCVIRLMEKILKDNGLNIDVVTYNVQPTSENEGFIEIVENCETLYNISEKLKISLINYLLNNNPNESVSNLRQKFKNSCAVQSIISYALSISDRNSENLMVTRDGNFFNIDFGYCLGADPKPLRTSCIRITHQMLDALGGENSVEYIEFKELCGKIYDILRRHVNTFVCLLSLIPTFKSTSRTSPNINEEEMMIEIIKRFCPGESYDAAVANLKTRIDNSADNSTLTKYHVIDFFHKMNKEKTVTNYLNYGYNGSKAILSSMYSYLYSFT